jgi:hypothetical protein
MRSAWLLLIVTAAIFTGCASGSEPQVDSKSNPSTSSAGTDEERAAREVDALVAQGRIGEAHTQARLFVQRYPDGPYTAHVVALMGVHPHREGPPPPAAVQGVKP